MATNSAASEASSYRDEELAKFLQDICKTTQLLKERISFLSAKYPVTAREKSLDELVDKLLRDIQERLYLIHSPPTPSPLPLPSPSPSPESTPSPVQEVSYSVDLYDSSLVRRRTLNSLGNLGQSLPRKKKVKETVNVEILTNDKYDPEKRAVTWIKSRELSILTATSLTESERYNGENGKSYSHDVPIPSALVIDIGKLNFKHQSVPYILFSGEKCDSTCQGVFSLVSPEHAQLKEYDPHDNLETAMKIARANYEYWSSVYYRGLTNKDKDPMQPILVKEYLRGYVKDPLRSKGIIYFYQVQKTVQNNQPQNQVYIGKSEGPFEEKLHKLHQSGKETPTLVKLALQSQALLSEASTKDDKGNATRNIVLIIDFGYTDEFFEKFKDRLDKGDKLATLEKNYIEYFGARSPIGLN